jgi:hypothetical protein
MRQIAVGTSENQIILPNNVQKKDLLCSTIQDIGSTTPWKTHHRFANLLATLIESFRSRIDTSFQCLKLAGSIRT